MIKDAIRHYRNKANLKQQELAEMLSCSIDTVRRWESGLRQPKAKDIKQLCDIFRISESELLNGPARETWELKVIYKKTLEGDVIDLTGNASNAEVLLGERAMSIKIDGPIDLWTDDQKFEDLIADLRRKRAAGMKTRKEGW